MARSDGLYREEVCQLNDGQSQLAINLRGTMAQGAQSQGKIYPFAILGDKLMINIA